MVTITATGELTSCNLYFCKLGRRLTQKWLHAHCTADSSSNIQPIELSWLKNYVWWAQQ